MTTGWSSLRDTTKMNYFDHESSNIRFYVSMTTKDPIYSF